MQLCTLLSLYIHQGVLGLLLAPAILTNARLHNAGLRFCGASTVSCSVHSLRPKHAFVLSVQSMAHKPAHQKKLISFKTSYDQ